MALAARCDEVLASDGSAQAVDTARQATAHLAQVKVQLHTLPGDWPSQTFDLIVLSEWAYYLSEADLAEVVSRCQQSLTQAGTLIACHWRPDFEQRAQSTAHVHARFHAHFHAIGWQRLIHHEERDFLMEAWSPQNISVAQLEGLT